VLAADRDALEDLPERMVATLMPDDSSDDIAVLVARIGR
jgi:hypothetical protein